MCLSDVIEDMDRDQIMKDKYYDIEGNLINKDIVIALCTPVIEINNDEENGINILKLDAIQRYNVCYYRNEKYDKEDKKAYFSSNVKYDKRLVYI